MFRVSRTRFRHWPVTIDREHTPEIMTTARYISARCYIKYRSLAPAKMRVLSARRARQRIGEKISGENKSSGSHARERCWTGRYRERARPSPAKIYYRYFSSSAENEGMRRGSNLRVASPPPRNARGATTEGSCICTGNAGVSAILSETNSPPRESLPAKQISRHPSYLFFATARFTMYIPTVPQKRNSVRRICLALQFHFQHWVCVVWVYAYFYYLKITVQQK